MNMGQLVVRKVKQAAGGRARGRDRGGVSVRGVFRQTWNGLADTRREISSTRPRPRKIT